jgi:hypothetical protein
MIISISVYGDNPKYINGAIENAKLIPTIYPGWTLKCYIKNIHDNIINQLLNLNVNIVDMNEWDIKSGMLWRFLAADDNVDHVIFRDADSRINIREKAAVDDWILSGKLCHIMRDHKLHYHRRYPIFGGMWGIRGNKINMNNLIKLWSYTGKYLDDMKFLTYKIWPLVQNDVHIHDKNHPFPPHQPYNGFVGQVIT